MNNGYRRKGFIWRKEIPRSDYQYFFDHCKDTDSVSDIEYLRELQLELASLSMEVHVEVKQLLEQYVHGRYGVPFVNVTDKALAPQSVAAVRKSIRKAVADYQRRIDELALEVIEYSLQVNAKPRTLLDYFN